MGKNAHNNHCIEAIIQLLNALSPSFPDLEIGNESRISQKHIVWLSNLAIAAQAKYPWPSELSFGTDERIRETIRNRITGMLNGKEIRNDTVIKFAQFAAEAQTEGQIIAARALVLDDQWCQKLLQANIGDQCLDQLTAHFDQSCSNQKAGPRLLIQFGQYADTETKDKQVNEKNIVWNKAYREFAIELGHALAKTEWELIFSGREFAPSYDTCQAFTKDLSDEQVMERVITYSCNRGREIYKNKGIDTRCMGRIRYDWEEFWHRRIPMVHACDVMLTTGGTERTGELMRFAEYIGKPVCSLSHFGGVSQDENSRSEYELTKTGSKEVRKAYDRVASCETDMAKLAKYTVDWIRTIDSLEHYQSRLRCWYCKNEIPEWILRQKS